ncbi:PEP-CTERM sorting domain-containing protein [Iodidimonas sp. SYSU 1G8]|uniref:PEP-CTERM sorting domain-containing protein n=1 Tax=Iodidimonas sp. SYSU 1G8 TaxID=3133967 RepID=UPI0031FEAA2E
MTRAGVPLVPALLLAALAGALMPSPSGAMSVNLISNGEFEYPAGITSYNILPTNGVPGWGTTDSGIEIWGQGFSGSPSYGSDGNPTGQSLELNANMGGASVFQTFTVPLDITSGAAVLSFDAWPRENALGTVSLQGTVSGQILAPSAIAMNGSLWTPNVFNVTVAAGEMVTLLFQAFGGTSAVSPHVDQVSFAVSVPEPGMLALSAAGLALLAGLRRRRRSH